MNETKNFVKREKCVCVRFALTSKGGTLLALTSLIKQEISIIEFVLCFCLHDVLCVSFFCHFCLYIEYVCFLPIQSLKTVFFSVFSSFCVSNAIVILHENLSIENVCIRFVLCRFFSVLQSFLLLSLHSGF